jgi:hypothetical protein
VPCTVVFGYLHLEKVGTSHFRFDVQYPMKTQLLQKKKNSCPLFQLYILIIEDSDSANLAMRTTISSESSVQCKFIY